MKEHSLELLELRCRRLHHPAEQLPTPPALEFLRRMPPSAEHQQHPHVLPQGQTWQQQAIELLLEESNCT